MTMLIRWFRILYNKFIQYPIRQLKNKNKKNELDIALEDIIANLPGHVYWLDRNNVFLGCNETQAAAAGFKRQEMIGKSNYDLPWREQADAYNAVNHQVMSTGREYSVEERGILADGRETITLSKKVPLRDKKGNIVGILGVSFDITEQKAAEKGLIDAKEKADIALENIIANLPGQVYWLDQNNVFLGCNEAQAVSAGFKRHEMVGKTNYEMPWQDQAEAFNRVNNQVMSTGQEHSVEEIIKRADGTEFLLLSKKVPLLDNQGNIAGILGISFDITEQKEAERQLIEAKEEAEAASKAKTVFLENMKHDLRTPVSSMIGVSELLNKEINQNKIRKYTGALVKSSKELLRFLMDMLDSVNASSGDIPLVKKSFNLKQVLDNVVDLHRPIALERQLGLLLEVDEHVPECLIGDPARIYRIVLELLTNALKFTHKGYVRVSVRMGKKTAQDVVIQIFIEDTGLGIPADKQNELFIRFNRLTPSYEGIYKGSGLGLSIVKQFIDDLGGEIYLDSYLDKGSKFSCIIPLKEPLLEDPFADDISVKPLKRCGLVVEDHPIASMVVETLFVEQGCEIDVVENGESAVVSAQKRHYHFMLIDIGLPDMSGCEVARRIRSFEKTSKRSSAFIIGLTCHADNQNKQIALDSGMNIVLNKPLSQEKIADLLENFIFESKRMEGVV